MNKGFSLIEILVALGVMALLSVILIPNIMNSLETRSLENTARGIYSTVQRAKFLAVRDKMNHRVQFVSGSGHWEFFIQREEALDNWTLLPGFVNKIISSRFNVTVNLPNADSGVAVEFSQLGFVANFDAGQNSIVVQSEKLRGNNQPDRREVIVFRGGSLRYFPSATVE